ncbi:MAG: hypothetical protein ACP6IY_20965 [Promethearchaeia archaeon]
MKTKKQSYNKKGTYEIRTKSGKLVQTFRNKFQALIFAKKLQYTYLEPLIVYLVKKPGKISQSALNKQKITFENGDQPIIIQNYNNTLKKHKSNKNETFK